MTTSLMHVHLPASIETQFRDTFLEELKTSSLEDIVDSCVNLIVDWQKQANAQTRRIARCLSIIHGPDELAAIMRGHIDTILGAKGAGAEKPSNAAVEGQQADPVIPIVILGVAVAVWLIGWAITGECDWYMGAYSP
jgi:hypothetical protein